VITSAANVVLSVANTQLTGTITNAQLGTDAVSNTKIAAGAVEQYFADTGFEAQFRNRIINGDMRIAQRGTAAVTASGAFPVDRFLIGNGTDGAYSAQQDSSAPTGFINSLKFTTTTADATLTTTQNIICSQRIEGTNISDLGWGTASAKTVTLSFWTRSSLTGTFGGVLRNSANDRSYPFTYSISVADTWEYKTVTVAGDTSGTWLTTTGIGVIVNWGLGVGPDRSGTAGAWAGVRYESATGAVSVIGTLDATWFITGVQLEAGSVATPFERRPFGTELALCQRYYYHQQATGADNYFSNSHNASTTLARGLISFLVQMRIAPSALTQSGTAGDYRVQHQTTTTTCSSVPALSGGSVWGSVVQFTVSSGLTAGQGSVIRSVNSSAYLGFSAEL
jgi:hypothetical protein